MKKVHTVKGWKWGVFDKGGLVVRKSGFPELWKTKKGALESKRPGETVHKVEITVTVVD